MLNELAASVQFIGTTGWEVWLKEYLISIVSIANLDGTF